MSLKFAITNSIKNEEDFNLIAGNSKYIIFFDKNIKVFRIDLKNNNKFIKLNFEYNKFSIEPKIIFHPNYINIFFLVYLNEINIFEILDKKIEKKMTINAHSKFITYFTFSEFDDKTFASYSDFEKNIKIWNLNNAFCIYKISTSESILKFILYEKNIYLAEENNITIFDYINYLEIKKINITCNDFIVLDEKTLLVFCINKIIIFIDGYLINIFNFEQKIYKQFYDNKLKLLYIFLNDKIYIININDMNIIFKTSIYYKKVFFIDNQINNNFICGNFIIFNDYLYIYSFISEHHYNDKNVNILKNSTQNFWKDCVNFISKIEVLNWNSNVIDKEEINKKNYVSIKTIEEEIINNYSYSLEDKKNMVVNELTKFKKNKENNVNLIYLSLIKMLIKDNTNKELIIEYLNFLKINEKNITISNNISFEEEFNYFKILFKKEELPNYNLKKNFSEKENFINLLKEILTINEKNLNEYSIKIKNFLKNCQKFNQPINYEQTELYWFRNIFVVYFSLKNIILNESYFSLMKNAIKKIIKKNLFNKNYILNNKEFITFLIMLIVLPEPEIYVEYNLNLIESFEHPKNMHDELIKNNFKKLDNADCYIYINDKNNYFALNEKDISKICLNNYLLNVNGKLKQNDFEFYNFHSKMEYFNSLIGFEKIKKFLSKIFSSKVFKQAFKLLYPSYFIFPFNNEKESLNFINKNFHFIPYKSPSTFAITEKFSFEIYYLLQSQPYTINKVINEDEKDLIKNIFYKSSVIKSSTHEINHEFYNILFMHSNGLIPLETPRKKFMDERESGKNFEILLFDRKVYNLNLLECMFILNENNYNKNLEDFRRDFNELKREDLQLNEKNIFYELNKVFKINNFEEVANKSSITCNQEENSNIEIFKKCILGDIENVNDVLGFIREPNKLY